MNVRHGFQIGFERPELLVLQLHMKIVGQRATKFGLDFRSCLPRRAAEEAIEDLVPCDRIAVTGEHLGVHTAGDDFAVDHDAVVPRDEPGVTTAPGSRSLPRPRS